MNQQSPQHQTVTIKPVEGWEKIDFRELYQYRDLFFFLVWRDIKVLYAQTILGFSWAILNPFIQIILFSVIFGKVAKLDTDGIPYVLFSTVAIVPWTYMSASMTASSQSLVSSQGILGKIYFPRLLYPITPVLAKLVDFCLAILLVIAVLLIYDVELTSNIYFLPIFILLMITIPAGIGLWFSSLAIRYRDVKFAMPFFISLMIYSAPIIYSASAIPDAYRLVYSLNPIVSVIEGFRSSLLGLPFEWAFIIPGAIINFLILASGAMYFRKMERIVVDVI